MTLLQTPHYFRHHVWQPSFTFTLPRPDLHPPRILLNPCPPQTLPLPQSSRISYPDVIYSLLCIIFPLLVSPQNPVSSPPPSIFPPAILYHLPLTQSFPPESCIISPSLNLSPQNPVSSPPHSIFPPRILNHLPLTQSLSPRFLYHHPFPPSLPPQ